MEIVPWVREHKIELLKFGTVGGVAFIIDLGLFNLLHTVDGAVLANKVVTAKVISAAVATLVAWVGNRLWTFSDHRTRKPVRELLLFGVINVIALALAAATVAFSTYVLKLTSPLADNVAAIVGIGIGTITRYIGYKKFVFVGKREPAAAVADA